MTAVVSRSITARVARNTSFCVAAAGIEIVRAAVTTPVLTRHLGVADYGSLGVGLTLLSLARPFVATGIAMILVRECAKHPEREAGLVAAGLRLGAISAVVFMAAAVATALLAGGGGGVLVVLPALSLSLVADALAISGVLVTVRLRDERTAAAQLVSGALFLAGTLALVAAGAGLTAVCLLFSACAGARALVLWSVTRRLRQRPHAPESRRDLAREAAPAAMLSFVAAAHMHMDLVLVAALAGAAQAGLLAAASRVAFLALVLPQAIASSLLPVLAKQTPAAAAATATRVSFGLGALGAVGVALSLPLSGTIVSVLGDGFADAAALLPLLGVRVWFLYLSIPLDALLISDGRQRLVAWLHAAAAAGSLALGLLVIPSHGAVGAVVVACITEGLKCASVLFICRRRSAPCESASTRCS